MLFRDRPSYPVILGTELVGRVHSAELAEQCIREITQQIAREQAQAAAKWAIENARQAA